MHEINTAKYFAVFKDENDFVVAIEHLGNTENLIKEIKQLNEENRRLKQQNKSMKQKLDKIKKGPADVCKTKQLLQKNKCAYLCWDKDNTVLGVATDEENAKNMCKQTNQAYMPISLNVACTDNVETTKLCTYNVEGKFLTYEQVLANGYTFSKTHSNLEQGNT